MTDAGNSSGLAARLRGQRRAALHFFDRVGDGVGERLVAQRFAGGPQRRHQRHAGADERPEHAARTAPARTARSTRPRAGVSQHRPLDRAACRSRSPRPGGCRSRRARPRSATNRPYFVTSLLAATMTCVSNGRSPPNSAKIVLNRGMKNVSRKISTARRQHAEHDRVDHRGLDLALEVLLAGAEVGDLLEDDGQEPARLARADHRDVDAGEDLRPLRQRVGQRRAADDVVVDLAPDALRGRLRRLAPEQRQRPRQRQPGGEQVGQLAGERFEAGLGDLRGRGRRERASAAVRRRRRRRRAGVAAEQAAQPRARRWPPAAGLALRPRPARARAPRAGRTRRPGCRPGASRRSAGPGGRALCT